MTDGTVHFHGNEQQMSSDGRRVSTELSDEERLVGTEHPVEERTISTKNREDIA